MATRSRWWSCNRNWWLAASDPEDSAATTDSSQLIASVLSSSHFLKMPWALMRTEVRNSFSVLPSKWKSAARLSVTSWSYCNNAKMPLQHFPYCQMTILCGIHQKMCLARKNCQSSFNFSPFACNSTAVILSSHDQVTECACATRCNGLNYLTWTFKAYIVATIIDHACRMFLNARLCPCMV